MQKSISPVPPSRDVYSSVYSPTNSKEVEFDVMYLLIFAFFYAYIYFFKFNFTFPLLDFKSCSSVFLISI